MLDLLELELTGGCELSDRVKCKAMASFLAQCSSCQRSIFTSTSLFWNALIIIVTKN